MLIKYYTFTVGNSIPVDSGLQPVDLCCFKLFKFLSFINLKYFHISN